MPNNSTQNEKEDWLWGLVVSEELGNKQTDRHTDWHLIALEEGCTCSLLENECSGSTLDSRLKLITPSILDCAMWNLTYFS